MSQTGVVRIGPRVQSTASTQVVATAQVPDALLEGAPQHSHCPALCATNGDLAIHPA